MARMYSPSLEGMLKEYRKEMKSRARKNLGAFLMRKEVRYLAYRIGIGVCLTIIVFLGLL